MIESPQTFGKYTLLERIATGGMAEIFKAKMVGVSGFDRVVAIKRLHAHLGRDSELAQMLVDEARISVQLHHQNIGQVFDLGLEGDVYFIVMEYLNGVDLNQMMKRAKERGEYLPIPFVVQAMTYTLAALEYAHSRRGGDGQLLQIIHRDVSPQNVMVTRDGEVKLIDFGIAKARRRAVQTQAGIIKGKFFYMAPEQAYGHELDHRVDIFAAGMLLYELLAGRPAYEEADDLTLLRRIRKGQFERPSRWRPELDPELEAIIMRALAVRRDDRFASARAFQTELEEYQRRRLGVMSATQIGDVVARITSDAVSPAMQRERLMDRADYKTSDSSLIFNSPQLAALLSAPTRPDRPVLQLPASEEPTVLFSRPGESGVPGLPAHLASPGVSGSVGVSGVVSVGGKSSIQAGRAAQENPFAAPHQFDPPTEPSRLSGAIAALRRSSDRLPVVEEETQPHEAFRPTYKHDPFEDAPTNLATISALRQTSEQAAALRDDLRMSSEQAAVLRDDLRMSSEQSAVARDDLRVSGEMDMPGAVPAGHQSAQAFGAPAHMQAGGFQAGGFQSGGFQQLQVNQNAEFRATASMEAAKRDPARNSVTVRIAQLPAPFNDPRVLVVGSVAISVFSFLLLRVIFGSPVAPPQQPVKAPVKKVTPTAGEQLVTLPINSQPTGARVMVDGVGVGSTPIAVPKMKVGRTYRLEMVKPNFPRWSQRVTLKSPPEPIIVNLHALKRPDGILEIKTSPPGLSIELDGKKVGDSPVKKTEVDMNIPHTILAIRRDGTMRRKVIKWIKGEKEHKIISIDFSHEEDDVDPHAPVEKATPKPKPVKTRRRPTRRRRTRKGRHAPRKKSSGSWGDPHGDEEQLDVWGNDKKKGKGDDGEQLDVWGNGK